MSRWEACGLQGKSGERGIPVPEVKSDGKSDCWIPLMPLHVKTAECCRHLGKYFKRLWLESLVGKAEKTQACFNRKPFLLDFITARMSP